MLRKRQCSSSGQQLQLREHTKAGAEAEAEAEVEVATKQPQESSEHQDLITRSALHLTSQSDAKPRAIIGRRGRRPNIGAIVLRANAV